MCENKINSIFRGQVVRKVYNCYRFDGFDICDSYEHVSYRELWKGFIEKPPFERKENVYINDLDITVEIGNALRSTNGEMIYNIYKYEIIEDEKTTKSLKDAEEMKLKYQQELKIKKLEQEKKNKKWYQIWK